jgi:hypothetical protein
MTPDLKVTMQRNTDKEARTPYKSFKLQINKDENGHEDRMVQLHTPKLLEWLRDQTNLEDIYDDVPVVSVYTLFNILDHIKNRARRTGSNALVKELVAFLEQENEGMVARVKNMLSQGQISFGMLRALYTPGTEIAIHGDEIIGGIVVDSQYHSSFFGTYLAVSFEYMSSNGQTYLSCRDNVKIPAWEGMREITKLPVRPVTEELKAKLSVRGERYAKIAIGSHYMSYAGHMEVKKWWSWNNMRADGRMMVDISTYLQFEDEYRERNENDTQMKAIPEEKLWVTDPYIRGFSFTTKQWGRFAVDRISNIEFRDDAFDQLVLAEDKKNLVHALVTNGTGGFADIISGKGGGCIFLLHGEPGVGKTLTAEAIAELLHRPLYSVAVGELGTDTAQLEKSLRQILDVAQIWNAVVLIDEADIFLEKRGHDVLRNSLTSVFLRLTEYHQGVMFLTTNRVKTFDPAFYSRISIALKYQGLTQESRAQIWTNLLSAAKVEGLDPQELSIANLNGRQIKNTIRLAQGLAAQQGVSVNKAHVMQVVDISQQFLEDLEGTDY